MALHARCAKIFNPWNDRDANGRIQAQDRVDRLLSQLNHPTLRALLELHRPTYELEVPYPVCRGCDTDDPDDEPPAWPCTTWRLIEQATRPS